MSTLTGTKIKDTYPGLLKTTDNAAVDPTVLKQLTDGTGGSLNISVSQVETKFASGSLVDFTGVTVLGLDGAGLVSGVGADSLKNADSLVTSAAIADGAQAVALGNGATANGAQSVSIGNGAQSTNNQGIAIGNFAESTSIGTAAVGEYASASGLYATAWGRTANAASDGAVAFGQQTQVPFSAPGGVAIGRQVAADLADTTHVRALKIVAPDGGTGGNGITLLSPDGTPGLVTLTNASELALDGTPIGGGGGGGMEATLLTTGRGVNLNNSSTSGDLFRTTYIPDTYATTSAGINNNMLKVAAMSLIAGQTIDSFGVYISSPSAAGTITAALYKAELDANGNIRGGALEYNFGTIDSTTGGLKVINGAGHTLGATVDNTYFLGVYNNSGSTVNVMAVSSTNFAGPVTHTSMYATTAYRGYTWFATNGEGLPANMNTETWSKGTDFPMFGLKFS